MSCYASSLSVCINVFYDRFLDGLVKAIRQKPQHASGGLDLLLFAISLTV